jgi:hypothetical protein
MSIARALAVSTGFAGLVAAQEWRTLPATAHPPAGFVAMAFDPVRQRTVCCVCEDVSVIPWTSVARTTTWEWDGARWSQRLHTAALSSLPEPIAMAWDGARQKVVLANRDRELWSFDGIGWQLEVPSLGSFDEPSLAFDAARGVLVCVDWGYLYEEQNGAWVYRAPVSPMSNGIRIAAAMPTNTAGFASASWTIPANPALRGIVVHEQALTLDPNGALFGFASLTGALQLRVGD